MNPMRRLFVGLLAFGLTYTAVRASAHGDRCIKSVKPSGSSCAHPHCPLATFKKPERPLQQLKALAGDIKQRVGRLLARLERQRRGQKSPLDVFEAEMALRQQILRQLQQQDAAAAAAGAEANGKAGNGNQASGSGVAARDMNYGPAGAAIGAAAEPIVFFVSETLERHQQVVKKQRDANPIRRALTYGNWVMDSMGFILKAISVILFQVLGAAMALQEYQKTGVLSSTLIRFSAMLFGLVFLPPVVVATRESLPSSHRNPIVRGFSRVAELALDVLVVSSLSLLFSLVLTIFLALPAYNTLLSYHLTEDYIRGCVGAGIIYFVIWSFCRNFEPLATKWFM